MNYRMFLDLGIPQQMEVNFSKTETPFDKLDETFRILTFMCYYSPVCNHSQTSAIVISDDHKYSDI